MEVSESSKHAENLNADITLPEDCIQPKGTKSSRRSKNSKGRQERKQKQGNSLKRKPSDKFHKPIKKARTEVKTEMHTKSNGKGFQFNTNEYTVMNEVISNSGDAWGQAIPADILVKIFQFVLGQNCFIPMITRVAQVCKRWYEASLDPVLWTHADLNHNRVRKTKKSLSWLSKNRMSYVQVLDLTGWKCLTDNEITLLSQYWPRLKEISLSKSGCLTSHSTSALAKNCTQLQSIDLSFATSHYVVSKRSLLHFISEAGPRLQELTLGWNILVSFDIVFNQIITSCSSLRVLDLTSVIFSSYILTINIEKMQTSCPLLEVFRIANSFFKATTKHLQTESPGFVHLKELNIARSTTKQISKFRYVTNEVLQRLLISSESLKILDISGCKHITLEGLKSVPAVQLESIDISNCKAGIHSDFIHVILRWSSSLQELDLSGTSVTPESLRLLLTECDHLDMVNLSTCRGLPRELRHMYTDPTALAELRTSLAQEPK